MHLEACSLEVLHLVGLAVCGEIFVEGFAQGEAELLKSTVLVPVLQDLAADGVLGILEPHFGGAVDVRGLVDTRESCVSGIADLACSGVDAATACDCIGAEAAKEHIVWSLIFRVGLILCALEPLGVVRFAVLSRDFGVDIGDRETVHISVGLVITMSTTKHRGSGR